MIIFPAIDLYQGKAVRLFKGNYDEMTVYSDNPLNIAMDFCEKGSKCVHIVDLEGARFGQTPNFATIKEIKNKSNLFCEVGGGIRDINIIDKYLSSGIDRVIIGTAAVEDPELLITAINEYKERIAVGVDVRNGYVSIHGWTENTNLEIHSFCDYLQKIGVRTIICTDISKDGAMSGTNREMYMDLSQNYNMNLIASGGVSSLDDIKVLKKINIHGVIIGKSYYTGAINLTEALEASK